MLIKTIIVLCVIFVPCHLGAVTAWVSPTGASAWGGCQGVTPLSGASACSALTAFANATAGDVVNFRSGTYSIARTTNNRFQPVWHPTNSGTDGNYITFQAYDAEVPSLSYDSASGTNKGPLIGAGYDGSGGVSYIVFDGFVINENGTYIATDTGPFTVLDSSYITIKNCKFYGDLTFNPADNHALLRVEGIDVNSGSSHHITVTNNWFQDVSTGGGGTSHHHAAFQTFNTDNVVFEYNTVVNASGVFPKGTTTGNAECNADWTINNNIFRKSDYGQQGVAICVAARIDIYQNIFEGYDDFGALKIMHGDDCNSNTVNFYNNTVYGSTRGWSMEYAVASGMTGYSFWNNIFYVETYGAYLYGSTFEPLIYTDYNNYYVSGGSVAFWYNGGSRDISYWQNTLSNDANGVTIDPSFIDAANHNFQRSTYPTNGRGGSYYTVMGAYITGAERIGWIAPNNKKIIGVTISGGSVY